MGVMNQKLCICLLLALMPLVSLAEDAYVAVFLGQVDIGHTQADSQYGLHYQSAQRWSGYDLIPVVGLMRTRHGSHFLYAGIERVTPFTVRDGGFSLALSLAPGLYHHGGSADTDLGFPLQFQSSVGLQYDFPDRTRLGIHFSHLSNASLSDINPGTETLSLRYGLAF